MLAGHFRSIQPWKELPPKRSYGSRYGEIRIVSSQLIYVIAGADENCLFLNIWTPDISSQNDSELLPVMFYIYGGSLVEVYFGCYHELK